MRNRSEQFEARLVQVRIEESPSILFAGMAGSSMPIVNSHGEGRVQWRSAEDAAKCLVAARYVDGGGNPTEVYPLNPNGSEGGVTSVTTPRRALYDHHAAPGTHAPHCADVVASASRGRALALDAHV